MIGKIIGKLKKEIVFYKKKSRTQCHFEKRTSIIGPEYFEFGNNVHIGKYYKLHCFDAYKSEPSEEYFPSIVIEDNCYISDYFTCLSADKVLIKKNTLIASYVLITSLNHGMKCTSELPYISQPLQHKPVIIGEGCWIGEKVMIMPGVEIGDRCIIGAGAVVTKSIPSDSIAVGNPAKVIKRFSYDDDSWHSI